MIIQKILAKSYLALIVNLSEEPALLEMKDLDLMVSTAQSEQKSVHLNSREI